MMTNALLTKEFTIIDSFSLPGPCTHLKGKELGQILTKLLEQRVGEMVHIPLMAKVMLQVTYSWIVFS